MAEPSQGEEIGRLPLLAEVPVLRRRRRVTARIRVSVTTAEERQQVAMDRLVQRAAIERVPVGREVE
ncbi:MAG: hypothetical protein K2X46_04285, partial [Roseomonas sp.]|nr:hypothetical protein [Roseomonas sp.]